jgi:hypothetical protein
MLLQARDELGINMSDAIFVGDSMTDVRAAIAAGVCPVLVLTGLGMEQLRNHYQDAPAPFSIALSLKHVVEALLQSCYPHHTMYDFLYSVHPTRNNKDTALHLLHKMQQKLALSN